MRASCSDLLCYEHAPTNANSANTSVKVHGAKDARDTPLDEEGLRWQEQPLPYLDKVFLYAVGNFSHASFTSSESHTV